MNSSRLLIRLWSTTYGEWVWERVLYIFVRCCWKGHQKTIREMSELTTEREREIDGKYALFLNAHKSISSIQLILTFEQWTLAMTIDYLELQCDLQIIIITNVSVALFLCETTGPARNRTHRFQFHCWTNVWLLVFFCRSPGRMQSAINMHMNYRTRDKVNHEIFKSMKPKWITTLL